MKPVNPGTRTMPRPAKPYIFSGPLLTKTQLAERYAVSVSCIDKWIKDRKIPVYRIARKCVRFDVAKCDAIIAKSEAPAGRTNRRRHKVVKANNRVLYQDELDLDSATPTTTDSKAQILLNL